MPVKSLIKPVAAKNPVPAKTGKGKAIQRKVLPGLFVPSAVQRKPSGSSWLHQQPLRAVAAPALVQPKIKVHAANDRFEKEADQVADKVSRNESVNVPRTVSPVKAGTQRKALSSQRNRGTRVKESLQTKANKSTAYGAVPAPPTAGNGTATHLQCADSGPPALRYIQQSQQKLNSVLSNQSSRGSPLPAPTRAFMERRMGADFSAVRIHTAAASHEANTLLGARAFTNGAHIHFAQGQYNPHTAAGRHLLAHELTHTVQQGAAGSNHLQKASASSVNLLSSSVQTAPERGPPAPVVQCSPMLDNAMTHITDLFDHLPSPFDGLEGLHRWLRNGLHTLAEYIPGYRAMTLILQRDPILDEHVERTGKAFIQAAIELIPGGRSLSQKLSDLGALDEAGLWVERQFERVSGIVSNVKNQFKLAWDELSITSFLAHPTRSIYHFGEILEQGISDVINFAIEAGTELLSIVKRYLLTQLVDFIKNHTNAYELLKVILGHDPITEEHVERNGTNILNALLEFGGEEGREQRRQMQDTGTFQKAADWIDRGIHVFGNLYQTIRQNFGAIWDIVSIDSLMNPVATFTSIYNIFAQPVADVLQFVRDALVAILGYIKEVLLKRLSAWARTIRGYPLVTVLIGKDPFTDEQVLRNVPNIIRGFMSLMEGGEEQYRQMEESGAIGRATQRIEAAVARLNMTPATVLQLFIDLWNSFSFNDLSHPVEAFQRIMARFGEPIARLIAFIIEIIKIVIYVILQVMNFPFDLINNIITRAMEAAENIKRDPVGFLKNLLRAIKQGFIQFFDNIATHLLNGVVGWLMSELKDANIPELKDFSLKGVISWILQVLGISMEAIWQKLAAHPRIGPERVAKIRSMINTLEGIWTFIQDVQQRGMAAIWDKIAEQLSNLWNTVLDAVKNWIMEKIITQITVKLLSLLDPTGIMAVINSAIAIYKAVQSFIRYLRQMLEVINSFVNGVADIAAGNVSTAANYLERTMDRAMPIVIGFLANQVGLSGIGKRIGEMVTRAREMVDQALTWLVNKAVNTGMSIIDRLMAMGRSAAGAILGWLGYRRPFKSTQGENHSLYFQGNNNEADLMVASEPRRYKDKLNELKKAGTITDVQYTALSAKLEKLNTLKRIQRATTPRREDDLAITNLVNEIATDTSSIIDAGGLPLRSLPIYHMGTSSAGFSKGVKVDRLTKNGPAGSPPTREMYSVWPDLDLRRQGSRPFYIKGHLLSNYYGGSGSERRNLTPLLQNHNTAFAANVERQVKTKYDNSEILYFEVVVDYQRGDNPNKAAIIAAETDPVKQAKLDKIITAEKHIPTQVTLAVDTIDKTTGARKMNSVLEVLDTNNIMNSNRSQYDVQPKLKMAAGNNNVLESEADHIADKVASGETVSSAPRITRVPNRIQQKPAGHKEPAGKTVQQNKIAIALKDQESRGSPIPAQVKNSMEQKIGADFSSVRIHTSADSHKANESIGARAFAHGANIHFANGEFNPGTKAGSHLLAHELVHTVQQGASPLKTPAPPVKEDPRKKGFPYHRIRSKAKTAGTSNSIERKTQATHLPGIVLPKHKSAKTALLKTVAAGAIPVPEESAQQPGAPALQQAPASAKKDPAFQQGKKSIKAVALKQRNHHEPALLKRNEASNAASLTREEQISQDGKEKNTGVIEDVSQQQLSPEKRFSAEQFKADLKTLINEKKPKTEEMAKEMAKNPPVGNISESFSSGVAKEQSNLTDPLEKNAVAEPTGGEQQKEIVSLPDPRQPPVVKPMDPKPLVPKPRTDAEISEKSQGDRVDTAMADNKLSDDQLLESKEPSFIQTYKMKEQAKQKAAEAPGEYRKKEEEILTGADAKAAAVIGKGLGGLVKKNVNSGKEVHGSQSGTESKTETRQREIKKTIEGSYTTAVTEVKRILQEMSDKVKTDFTNSLKAKTDQFNANLRSRISSYYGDWRIDDELFGPDPVVVNEDGSTRKLNDEEIIRTIQGEEIECINPDVYRIFVSEKKNFTDAMDIELDGIAGNVETGLRNAHNTIAAAKTEIDNFKKGLSGEELAYANELETDVNAKFGMLENSIDDARDDLLHSLADQYRENLEGMKKSFKEIDDELKKSWIDRAIEFIKTVGKTIYQLVDLIITILARLISIVWDIIKHPIRFFETLVRGLGEGISDFVSNISTYMAECFWTWITGAVPSGGVQLSMGSGAEGMFKLVVNVLNIGMEDLKKVAEKVLGREFMGMIDKVTDMINKGMDVGAKVLEPVMILLTKGPMALWLYIKEHVQEFIQTSFERIRESVFFAFIEKGIKWIASFFIPGGGFVKVVKAIVAAFQFIAENIENIRNFFDSIFDSMEAAIAGDTSGVKNKVVQGLKLGVVMALDFLAKVLGIDKIINSIHEILGKIKKAILSAVEFILLKIKPFVLSLVGKIKAAFQKGKQAVVGAKDAVVGAGKKVLGWLGFKKHFTSDAGKKHDLFFSQHGSGGQLMIASTPTPVKTYLHNRKAAIPQDPALAPDAKTAQLHKAKTAETLVQEIETLTYPRDRNASQGDDHEMQILEKSESLIALLKELDPSGAQQVIPAPVYMPGFSNSVQAQHFEAAYLSDTPQPNYQHGEAAKKYKGDLSGALPLLDQMGVRAKWVAFHIVNENYGGKATSSNLVPTPQYINKDYRYLFEDKLKDLLADKHVIWMQFGCKYRSNEPFLDSLSAEGGAMKFENNQWVKDPAVKVAPYRTKVDIPKAESIAINHLEKDPVLWYFYEKETALELSVLDFLAGEVKKGIRFSNKQEIITHLETFYIAPTTSKGERSRLTGLIQKTNFSFD